MVRATQKYKKISKIKSKAKALKIDATFYRSLDLCVLTDIFTVYIQYVLKLVRYSQHCKLI